MYPGRVTYCPLVGHGEYANGTDRRTDTRPLHCAFFDAGLWQSTSHVCLRRRILGGRALGLGFSRPQVTMSLANESDLRHGEQKPFAVSGRTMSECSFMIDKVGCCKAEFHGVHVDQLQPQNGRNAATLQKYAFVFRTTVNVCGCQIPLEVLPSLCSVTLSCRWFAQLIAFLF